MGIKIAIQSNIDIWCGYVKIGEYLYSLVVIWVNTILNHIDARSVLLRYEGFCMVYRREWYQEKNYRQIPTPYWYQKM